MKKLYAVTQDGKPFSKTNPTFSNKDAAKAHRKTLNTVCDKGFEVLNHVVSFGPDHHRFKG